MAIRRRRIGNRVVCNPEDAYTTAAFRSALAGTFIGYVAGAIVPVSRIESSALRLAVRIGLIAVGTVGAGLVGFSAADNACDEGFDSGS